jgi:hypothetical protein
LTVTRAAATLAGMEARIHAIAGRVVEWGLAADHDEPRAAHGMDLDLVVTHESGAAWRVPGFWSGGADWRVRFLPPSPGRYEWRSECSDPADTGLHGKKGTLRAEAGTESSSIQARMPRVAPDGRCFTGGDGSPFLWLGDTWWMGLCSRWRWPQDFQLMCSDRQRKGFNVVQVVAGLYPDMPAFDPRGANEGGFPWAKGWSVINPAWFNAADQRIEWMVRSGICPCIVGAWGYYLPWLGVDGMKKHWRTIVARWSAYPVFWCLAGEATMPYYLSQNPDGDRALQREGWTEIAGYVKRIDPWKHPVSLHTAYGRDSRDEVADPALVDFALIQGGNSGYFAQEQTVRIMKAAVARRPLVPAVQGETCYEGAQGTNSPDMVRFCFWSTLLSGIAGYTYGADGIWQINGRDSIYGASPTGMAWGDCLWEDMMNAPGASQVALGAALLRKLPWQSMRPHPEWIEPAADDTKWFAPYAAGIPGRLRIVYYPLFALYPWLWSRNIIKGIEPGVCYRARLVDPRNGTETDLGEAAADRDGTWRVPCPPVSHDWLLIMEA